MPSPAKQIVLGAALLVGISMVTNADPLPRSGDNSAASGAHPYTSGIGAKAGPSGRVRAEHYQAPPDYVTDIAMHPYTSGVGLKAGPNRALRVKDYQVPPGYDADVAKHPYSSGIGPATEASRNRPGDLRPVAVSHYDR